MITLFQIDKNHSLYQEERLLRNEVLLRPIGIPDFGWEHHDDSAWHFVAVKDQELIGCVLLAPMDANKKSVQLTQMAVKSNVQGQGVGKLLVLHLIDFSIKNKFDEIHIHARDTVTPFYEIFGFKIYGEDFEEVGIKHKHMCLRLKTDHR